MERLGCLPKFLCLPHITIEETELKTVHQFTYLGCEITSDAKIDREIDKRLAKSNNAFGRLYKRVWKNKHLKKGTKISVYRAVIPTTLPYGSEAWVTYRHNVRLLERFHQRCLRIIIKIHWSDYVTNVAFFAQAEITCIEAMLMKTATLGRRRLQNGRLSLTQDDLVWRALHWPPRQRSAKKTL